MNSDLLDCIIIGGGPAGLMAATYLGRYRCKIKLIDSNESRARLIPLSHNFPTYPKGITGEEILRLMREQSNKYSHCIIHDTTLGISYDSDTQIFNVQNINTHFFSKNIILATGVVDIEPKIPNLPSAIKDGLIRHCVICDGFEVIDKKIALIAQGRKAVMEALFLINYAKDLTIFTLGSGLKLDSAESNFFKIKRIKISTDAIEEVIINHNKSVLVKTIKENYAFDSVYSGLGSDARSDLAIKLGAKHLQDKRLITNLHQETNIPGLFAIGDVVAGLSQMSVGMSHAAQAATAIFKAKLREQYKSSRH